MYWWDEIVMMTKPQVEEACDYVQSPWIIWFTLFHSTPSLKFPVSEILLFQIFSGGNISTSQPNGGFSMNYTGSGFWDGWLRIYQSLLFFFFPTKIDMKCRTAGKQGLQILWKWEREVKHIFSHTRCALAEECLLRLNK